MASHHIAIAKASFAASLLRPDPTPVPRSEVDAFHALLAAVTTECSPQNIQKCKRWVLGYVAPSRKRVEGLGRYLVALGNSFVDAPKSAAKEGVTEVSVKRKRLHILYLVNDVVHHTKIRLGDPSVAQALETVLPDLFSKAAEGKGDKHKAKLERLLDLWSSRGYFPFSTINALRDAVKAAQQSLDSTNTTAEAKAEKGDETKRPRELPFVMPSQHGDYNTAWYDLPAANLMPHIVPNSTRPIKGSMVQPLQFTPGVPDSALVDAVKNLLEDAGRMYGEDDAEGKGEGGYDVDAMGQRVVKDEVGERKVESTYYGWSEEFAVKMGRKKKGIAPAWSGGREERERDEERRYSSSRSRSRSPMGRGMGFGSGMGRRDSYSGSEGRSGSRSRSRGYRGGFASGGRMSGRERSGTPESMMPRGLGY